MNLFRITLINLCITLAVIGCNPLKKIEVAKTNALSSFDNKQYATAYSQLTALIDNYKQNNIKVANELYMKTGECAVQLKEHDKASDYYLMALKDSVSLSALKGYLNSLNQLLNYDKASATLSEYQDFLKANGQEEYLVNAQFTNAVNKANPDKIVETYPNVTNPNEEQSMNYISSLEQLGKKNDAAAFCNQLIKDHPDYLKAKEWKAIYHYNLANDWYKSEMDKYNKDKNYTAYVYLKRELKKISANYRVSKSIFEELHKKFPEEKKYIKYLKNTYIRLDMKNEAAALDKLLN